jgi:hypothetical protein
MAHAETLATGVSDPSADGTLLAWHVPGQVGVLVNGDQQTRLGGAHPALGGGRLAVLANDTIQVVQTSGPAFSTSVAAPGADALAVDAEWVAWRARVPEGDALFVAPLAGGQPRRIAVARELGRPALEGGRLAYAVAGRTGSRIVLVNAATGKKATVRRERRALLSNPALHGGRLLYVRNYYKRQELRIGPQTKRSPTHDRRLWSIVPTGRRDAGHDPGKEHHRHGWPRRLWPRPKRGLSATMWTTALGPHTAYVTLLRQIAGQPLQVTILRVPRQRAG